MVTEEVVAPGVNVSNASQSLSGLTRRDFFFLRGCKELIEGTKILLLIVEGANVTPSNVGSFISGATSEDYYTLKGFQELFDGLGL